MKKNEFKNIMDEKGFNEAMMAWVAVLDDTDRNIVSRKTLLDAIWDDIQGGLLDEVKDTLQMLLDNLTVEWFLYEDGKIKRFIFDYEDIEEFLEDDELTPLEMVQKLIIEHDIHIDDLFTKDDAFDAWSMIAKEDVVEYVRDTYSIRDMFDEDEVLDYARDYIDIADWVEWR